jgi:glycosyltransferase involved in cell wall biosynthesis
MFSIIIPVAKGRTAESSLHALPHAGLTSTDEILLVGDSHLPTLNLPDLPAPIHLHASTAPGAPATRNLGATLARNPVLCFLDDDDAYLPGALQRLRTHIIQYPEQTVWCLDCQLLSSRPQPQRPNPIPLTSLCRRNLAGTASSLVIRKSFFDSLNGFDESFPAMQDWDLWFRIAQQTDIPTLSPPFVLYDDAPRPRISTDNTRRLQGLRQFYSKHRASLPPGAKLYHKLRQLAIRLNP